MKKFRKLLALVLAVAMVCAVSVTAWAEEAPDSTGVEVDVPVSRPADPGSFGQLIDTEQITYTENGCIVTERYNVYAPTIQPFAGVQTVTHEITKTVTDSKGMVAFVATLDADFECDAAANTVAGTRYYCSYSDISPNLGAEPEEINVEAKENTTGTVAWYKLRAQTQYTINSIQRPASFWMTIGSDAKGKKLTSW